MRQWCRTSIAAPSIKIAVFFKKSLPMSKMLLGWVKKSCRWPDWPWWIPVVSAKVLRQNGGPNNTELEMKSGKGNKSRSSCCYFLKSVWKENVTPEEHLHKCNSKCGFCWWCHFSNRLVAKGFSSSRLLHGRCEGGTAAVPRCQRPGKGGRLLRIWAVFPFFFLEVHLAEQRISFDRCCGCERLNSRSDCSFLGYNDANVFFQALEEL